MRADSARNRAALVAAAREVFAEHGLDATLDDIAARAGVGTGTAYRHFRNKQELAAEVLGEATEQIVLDAEAALAVEDPWVALVTFFETAGARQASDRGLYQALAGLGRPADKVRLWPDIVRTVTTLLDRARAAGVVRPDVQPEDVAFAFSLLGPAFDLSRAGQPDVWRRHLAVILDGLRATDRGPLPGAPPRLATLDDLIATSTPRRRRR
ncbi:MAG TPA: helix-turn-helix domain-containing protein [Iamia sp.]|nr:helix-turn-helix domain-containing protein [Iamia sp.]